LHTYILLLGQVKSSKVVTELWGQIGVKLLTYETINWLLYIAQFPLLHLFYGRGIFGFQRPLDGSKGIDVITIKVILSPTHWD